MLLCVCKETFVKIPATTPPYKELIHSLDMMLQLLENITSIGLSEAYEIMTPKFYPLTPWNSRKSYKYRVKRGLWKWEIDGWVQMPLIFPLKPFKDERDMKDISIQKWVGLYQLEIILIHFLSQMCTIYWWFYWWFNVNKKN